jgi:thiamine pyrophosphate-dependent acetolactate synthase large subunit-like protein
MRMNKAVAALCEQLGPDELVITANGAISRELYTAAPRNGNFYMLGSMGQASSIALGAALSRPDRRVIALDGDGNLIMNMGILATVAQLKPANFVHVVLDNGVYETTGSQPTAASVVDLAKTAKAAGYRSVATARTQGQVRRAARRMLSGRGPALLLVKTRPGHGAGLERIPLTAGQIAQRFRSAALTIRAEKKKSRRKKKARSRKTGNAK